MGLLGVFSPAVDFDLWHIPRRQERIGKLFGPFLMSWIPLAFLGDEQKRAGAEHKDTEKEEWVGTFARCWW